MSVRYLLLGCAAAGLAVAVAFGDDKPKGPVKKSTVEEDTARLVGKWELRRKADPFDLESKEVSYKVTLDKDGTGSVVVVKDKLTSSYGFNWAVTEVKGRGRVLVMLGNGASSAAVQYDFLDDEKKKAGDGELIGWTGSWDGKIRLAGRWKRVDPKRK